MAFKDLREYMALLEEKGQLKRIARRSIPSWRSARSPIA